MIFGVGVVPSTHGTPAIKEAPVTSSGASSLARRNPAAGYRQPGSLRVAKYAPVSYGAAAGHSQREVGVSLESLAAIRDGSGARDWTARG